MIMGSNLDSGDDVLELYLEPVGTPLFFTYASLCVFLTLFAGLMSGLTVGYLSIDKLDMHIKHQHGTK
jgi:metal transporter CNNM